MDLLLYAMCHHDATAYFGALCGDMQGTMEGAAIISGTILSIGGLAGSLTTNIWVRLGERRGYFRTISYCMLGSGVVLLLQSLPVGIWWFGVLQVLIGSCIVGSTHL